jgi:integrase
MLRHDNLSGAETDTCTHSDNMSGAGRPRRSGGTPKGAYAEPSEGDIWHPEGNGERWQQDWTEAEPAAEPAAAAAPATAERPAPGKRKKGGRERTQDSDEEEPHAAAGGVTKAQRREELQRFIQTNRNQNTSAVYASAWRQFERWVLTVENATRTAGNEVDFTRPEEEDVAAYMRYLVTAKRSPMTSVATALAGIADRVRFDVTDAYHPCRGKLVDAMKAALTPMAAASQQKQEMAWPLLEKIADAAAATAADTAEAAAAAGGAMRHVALRDRCMFLLAYHVFLRASEVVRMKRSDITLGTEEVDGTNIRVMRVHVNRMAKNDKERKGHERLVGERPPGDRLCMVRCMTEYLEGTRERPGAAPLFPTETGAAMSGDTPNGRLKVWLRELHLPEAELDVTAYGFHSLRAGGATGAARAGVHERHIKQHGNWKSDAYRVYIRPNTSDRLKASAALGGSAGNEGDTKKR